MEELGPGLYEALVTEGLKAQLDSLVERLPSRVRDLRAAEAPDRIAWHLSKQIESALADVGDAERVGVGLSVARALLDRLGELVAVDPAAVTSDPATVLHAVLRRLPDGRPEEIDEPLIPLLDTTLLTNAPGEPNLSASVRDRVVRLDRSRDGLHPAKRHQPAAGRAWAPLSEGRPLRVLTTTYAGSTERRAARVAGTSSTVSPTATSC